jgi:hypothetical protein
MSFYLSLKVQIFFEEETELIYEEAIQQNRTAVIERSLRNGLSEFLVGNFTNGSICEVILNSAFTDQQSNETIIFLKVHL